MEAGEAAGEDRASLILSAVPLMNIVIIGGGHNGLAAAFYLARHGVEFLPSPVDVFAPALNGPSLVLHHDAARADPAYAAYRSAMDEVSWVVASLLSVPAPSIDSPDSRDLLNLL